MFQKMIHSASAGTRALVFGILLARMTSMFMQQHFIHNPLETSIKFGWQ
jgi:hypothetical protein